MRRCATRSVGQDRHRRRNDRREADALAPRLITARGFGDAFGHSLGHGLGLEVHEGPRVAATSEEPLPVGAVVTVEPGIYLPGWGGVRLRDDVWLSPMVPSSSPMATRAPRTRFVGGSPRGRRRRTSVTVWSSTSTAAMQVTYFRTSSREGSAFVRTKMRTSAPARPWSGPFHLVSAWRRSTCPTAR